MPLLLSLAVVGVLGMTLFVEDMNRGVNVMIDAALPIYVCLALLITCVLAFFGKARFEMFAEEAVPPMPPSPAEKAQREARAEAPLTLQMYNGSFKQFKADNLDKYLTACNVPYLLRAVVLRTAQTHTFRIDDDEQGFLLTVEAGSAGGNSLQYRIGQTTPASSPMGKTDDTVEITAPNRIFIRKAVQNSDIVMTGERFLEEGGDVVRMVNRVHDPAKPAKSKIVATQWYRRLPGK